MEACRERCKIPSVYLSLELSHVPAPEESGGSPSKPTAGYYGKPGGEGLLGKVGGGPAAVKAPERRMPSVGALSGLHAAQTTLNKGPS